MFFWYKYLLQFYYIRVVTRLPWRRNSNWVNKQLKETIKRTIFSPKDKMRGFLQSIHCPISIIILKIINVCTLCDTKKVCMNCIESKLITNLILLKILELPKFNAKTALRSVLPKKIDFNACLVLIRFALVFFISSLLVSWPSQGFLNPPFLWEK